MPALAAVLAAGMAAVSCNKIPVEKAQGSLRWRFSSGLPTRAPLELPDTDAFILTVTNSANDILYEGDYGHSPESMTVNPGTYTVKAVSRVFKAPEFDAPQFGDEQVVVVKAGADTRVNLGCSQLNCGLRLKVGAGFRESYPGGSLFVTSAEGRLSYGIPEERTGFFLPGNLTVVLDDGNGPVDLVTRNLQAREILTLGITAPGSSSGETGGGTIMSITVDTLRTWTEDEYTIGSGGADPGLTPANAYGVAQAKEHVGEKGVWVCGYIVGGDLTSGKDGIRFAPPFESMSCIAIAARSSVSEKGSCIAVQLAKGSIRDGLNLADHPDLLGRKVCLKGNIEQAYYGITGLKNLTEYTFTDTLD